MYFVCLNFCSFKLLLYFLHRVDQLRVVWNSRWDWFHKPIHAVANILHPLWRSEEQYACNELETGFMTYVQKLCHDDMEMLMRIEDDLLAFRNHSGSFGRATAKLRETQLQPVSWWEKYGTCAPTLVSNFEKDHYFLVLESYYEW